MVFRISEDRSVEPNRLGSLRRRRLVLVQVWFVAGPLIANIWSQTSELAVWLIFCQTCTLFAHQPQHAYCTDRGRGSHPKQGQKTIPNAHDPLAGPVPGWLAGWLVNSAASTPMFASKNLHFAASVSKSQDLHTFAPLQTCRGVLSAVSTPILQTNVHFAKIC